MAASDAAAVDGIGSAAGTTAVLAAGAGDGVAGGVADGVADTTVDGGVTMRGGATICGGADGVGRAISAAKGEMKSLLPDAAASPAGSAALPASGTVGSG